METIVLETIQAGGAVLLYLSIRLLCMQSPVCNRDINVTLQAREPDTSVTVHAQGRDVIVTLQAPKPPEVYITGFQN
jgi:hypothetical protein